MARSAHPTDRFPRQCRVTEKVEPRKVRRCGPTHVGAVEVGHHVAVEFRSLLLSCALRDRARRDQAIVKRLDVSVSWRYGTRAGL